MFYVIITYTEAHADKNIDGEYKLFYFQDDSDKSEIALVERRKRHQNQ